MFKLLPALVLIAMPTFVLAESNSATPSEFSALINTGMDVPKAVEAILTAFPSMSLQQALVVAMKSGATLDEIFAAAIAQSGLSVATMVAVLNASKTQRIDILDVVSAAQQAGMSEENIAAGIAAAQEASSTGQAPARRSLALAQINVPNAQVNQFNQGNPLLPNEVEENILPPPPSLAPPLESISPDTP
ncbi:MAG: hypothetical protein P1U57_03970 [Oleibacter sp.]|nr:hypothetical protein [Thalassolituus sp.]